MSVFYCCSVVHIQWIMFVLTTSISYSYVVLTVSRSRLQKVMPPPLTHDEFLSRVCGICWENKNKDKRNISESLLAMIHKHHSELYSLENPALPKVVCNTCRKKLLRCQQVLIILPYKYTNCDPSIDQPHPWHQQAVATSHADKEQHHLHLPVLPVWEKHPGEKDIWWQEAAAQALSRVSGAGSTWSQAPVHCVREGEKFGWSSQKFTG